MFDILPMFLLANMFWKWYLERMHTCDNYCVESSEFLLYIGRTKILLVLARLLLTESFWGDKNILNYKIFMYWRPSVAKNHSFKIFMMKFTRTCKTPK